ncbi:MAG: P-II family nitrogen regulator [bacterium]
MIDINTLLFVVVSRGQANAVLRKARECGATGGTIVLGEGTVQNMLLEKLGLTEVHKEILLIPTSEEICAKLHATLSETFQLSRRNRGIAFSVPFRRWLPPASRQEVKLSGREDNYPYSCIVTIVDKGRSKKCLKAARAAGARGGTLIHGHGAGVPTDFYFPLVIEPQKDMVLIVTAKEKAPPIREKIFFDLELAKPGNGIIFILPVSRASGIVENGPAGSKEAIS